MKLGTKETVGVEELADTDIFRLLMKEDRVNPKDFLELCRKTRSEIRQNRGFLER